MSYFSPYLFEKFRFGFLFKGILYLVSFPAETTKGFASQATQAIGKVVPLPGQNHAADPVSIRTVLCIKVNIRLNLVLYWNSFFRIKQRI